MVLIALDNNILNQLCSEDQLELLDAVDGLRSQGIDSYVSLPQIIVCGDQSSGKSSVLEAISGVSFPVQSSLCTRFPTELVLRKTLEIGVSISIVPDPSHSDSESFTLRSFHERLDSFHELPELIEKAKTAMAISTVGKTFSKDLLRIEISGPDRPHLTIVDLPGLIHSETKQQSASDIELVQDVVKSYMEEPRSIILAVISAKNDYANQIVLKLARAADKKGNRTLGVITKPDTLTPGSASERTFVSLAKNQDVNFRLGWHVLKNLDSDTGKWSLSTRDIKEREFFSEGIWRTLPNSHLGIGTLRERLSELLLTQIAAELPSLIAEIKNKSDFCQAQLQKLGKPRITLEEQRLYLLQMSELCQSLIKAAVDGSYNDPFFGDARSDDGFQKRLRAVIQKLNTTFAGNIVRKGHRYDITDTPAKKVHAETILINRAEFMDHIEHLLERTRGRELPGTYNPMIVADLFAEQSRPWETIVRQHLEEVSKAVKDFLRLLVPYIADGTTSEQLFRTVFEPALHKLEEGLEKKLTELLAEHQSGHPITYNRAFTESIDEVCKVKMESGYSSIIKDFFQITSLDSDQYCEISDFRPLLKALMEYTQPVIARPACSKALDCMEVYYKIALQRFIDDVSVEAVESNMMSKLHGILRPVNVVSMTADDVTKIAGEPERSKILRDELTSQLGTLAIGVQICTRIMSIGLRGTCRVPIVPDQHSEIRQDLTSESPSKSLLGSMPPSTSTIYSGEDIVWVNKYTVEAKEGMSPIDEPALSQEEVEVLPIYSKKIKKKKGKRAEKLTDDKDILTEFNCED